MVGGVLCLAQPDLRLGAAPDKPVKKKQEEDPKPAKVVKAIQAGIKYLREKQQEGGSWEIDVFGRTRYPGGWSCLTMLALLEAGVPVKDKAIQNGLKYLRTLEPKTIYVRALQTMVFARAGQKQDAKRIQANVDWLLEARILDDNRLRGWSYTQAQKMAADNSNTHFAVLALDAARRARAKIPKDVWKQIRAFYLKTQKKDGGWIYADHHNKFTYLTMDVAGFSGLLISGMALDKGREIPQKDGKVKKDAAARATGEVKQILKALNNISVVKYEINFKEAVYYNLYGLSHLGRFSGLRFFGKHDWYKEGCDLLTDPKGLGQAKDGSWPEKGLRFDQWPVINTSFALLFLSQGRKPVPLK
jgi:hypothetical protein